MSQVKYETPFKAFRGKICKHTDIIYKKMGNTAFTSQICNPRTKPFSAEELARQDKFKTAATTVRTILADATQRAAAEAGFKAQSKYTTLYGFVFAREYAKL